MRIIRNFEIFDNYLKKLIKEMLPKIEKEANEERLQHIKGIFEDYYGKGRIEMSPCIKNFMELEETVKDENLSYNTSQNNLEYDLEQKGFQYPSWGCQATRRAMNGFFDDYLSNVVDFYSGNCGDYSLSDNVIGNRIKELFKDIDLTCNIYTGRETNADGTELEDDDDRLDYILGLDVPYIWNTYLKGEDKIKFLDIFKGYLQYRIEEGIHSYYRYITIYFPEKKVTNEEFQSTVIKDVYIRVALGYRGIPTHGLRILRTTFSKMELIKHYVHSHAQLKQYTNFDLSEWGRKLWLEDDDRFSSMCLGEGPINGVFDNLGINIDSKDADIIWEDLCISIDQYLEVESIEGTPYIYLKQLHHGNGSKLTDSDLRTALFNMTYGSDASTFKVFNTVPFCWDNSLPRFSEYYIKNSKRLKFVFRNGRYTLGMSMTEYMIDLSREFAKYCNYLIDRLKEDHNAGKDLIFRYNEILVSIEDYYKMNTVQYFSQNGILYRKSEDSDVEGTNSTVEICKKLMDAGRTEIIFNGEEKKFKIDDYNENVHKTETFGLVPRYNAIYLLSKMLNYINKQNVGIKKSYSIEQQ